jgi:hypothetical protein
MGTRGVVAERFSLGSSQPKPRAGRRKHIADGPQGAASMGASKAKVDPPSIYALRAVARAVPHDPFFSRDAMAALPRKWVSDGAPTLP